jgi:CRP-like cAMP-binding protein
MGGDQSFITGIEFIDLTREVVYELWDVVHETSKRLTTFLSTNSELQTFPLSELMEVAHATRYRSIPCGGLIYRQEERSSGDDSIFIILEGTVVLETRSKRGRRVELCRLGSGCLFGGTPLVTGTSHRESAIACCDVGLLDISRGAFEKMKRQRASFAMRLSSAIVENHASRLHDSLLKMVEAG